jgi:hypothetical protein
MATAGRKPTRGHTPKPAHADLDEPRPPSRARVAVVALALTAASGFVYLLVAGSFCLDFRQTDTPHHIFMADALLHGQLAVRPEALQWKMDRLRPLREAAVDRRTAAGAPPLTPASRAALVDRELRQIVYHDYALWNGRVYGYWGPLTPVVMMPLVALFGLDVSDTLISALFGAANVGLFYWLLCRADHTGLCPTSGSCRVALALLLAFGTSHFWLACAGQIWFAVQIVTLGALLLALIAAFAPANRTRDWLLCGVFFGAAILGRSVVATLGLFFLALIWIRVCGGKREPVSARVVPALRRVIAFCLPAALAMGVQGLYNYGRFGSFSESGVGIQIRTRGNPRFLPSYEKYGAFSLHYVPENFKYYFWNCDFPIDSRGRRSYDPNGNSIFMMTPPLLYLFLLWRRWSAFAAAALLGAIPLVAVLLCFNGSGWMQFGPRYLLDATPLLLLLVALGMRGRITYVSYVLIVLAVGVQVFGASRMLRAQFGALQDTITVRSLLTAVILALVARVLLLGLAHVACIPRAVRNLPGERSRA